jgi:site-specific DNA-methyltransferase (adenine-specific)
MADFEQVQIGNATLYRGDCMDVLRTLPDNSLDSVVTDPPYGLAFMGKKWDYDVPDTAVWAECLRVLKPGGHLLAFAGTRTQHRMAVRIEDAGFEIRDMIAWVYGSGFPKSLDVSKAIDKAAGATRDVIGVARRSQVASAGWDRPWKQEAMQAQNSTVAEFDITTPATEAAREWQGWGTALKPALEPITMARKPLTGTVAANVLRHGTGALNIDASRVGWVGTEDAAAAAAAAAAASFADSRARGTATQSNSIGKESRDGINRYDTDQLTGRWPANLIHDGSTEVTLNFPNTSSGMMHGGVMRAAQDAPGSVCYGTFGGAATPVDTYADSGSAARFFYSAKASADDRSEGLQSFAFTQQDASRKAGDPGGDNPRNRGLQTRQNHHPTVKPTDLMHYLLRLVTPPGGVALDPFMGSGSTGKAAAIGDFKFIGIERDPDYFAIACARLEYAHAQGKLFA